MFVVRFFTVIAAETYDTGCKLVDIAHNEIVSVKQILKVRKIKKELRAKMDHANSYAEWHEYAEEYDKLTEVRIWKETQESPDYDWAFIKRLTQSLREARLKEDFMKLMHVIRSNAMRNLANTLNPSLYCESYIGTKHLIENYQSEVVACLDYICSLPESKLPKNRKLEFFAETRHAFGRTGLIFSGGGNIGLYHHGVIKALYEENLLPRIVAGTSAGSLFATFFCVRKMQDVPFMLDPTNIKLDAFHRRSRKFSLARKLGRLFSEGYLLDVGVIKDFMRENIGDITFQEAYDATGWILNITVTGSGEHDGYRLLNYLTAPNVLIWSAVCASCGIPYIYGPVDLYCKDENNNVVLYSPESSKFVDGSIGADVPMQNLSEMFNVNYFVVSQTNFWIVPFLNHSEQHRHAKRTTFYKIWEIIKDLLAAEMKHRINQFTRLGLVSKAISRYFNLLTQQYSGHVTIWPDFTFQDLIDILRGVTTEMLRNCIIEGARRVYPKINRIRATLIIERALERNYLKARALVERPVVVPEFLESDYDNNDDREGVGESFLSNEAGDIMSQLCRSPNDNIMTNNRCRIGSFNVPRSVTKSNLKYLIQDPDQSQEILKESEENGEGDLYRKVTS